MPAYFPDTNVLIDFSRDPEKRNQLERALKRQQHFVIAPPALIELTRGLVRGDRAYFAQNQPVFIWFRDQDFDILPLPTPFMAEMLKTELLQKSGVTPDHYREQIAIIANAADFDDFLTKIKATVWRDLDQADEIHRAELDKEFVALSSLAKGNVQKNFAELLARKFEKAGARPEAPVVADLFSAALEFLESSVAKVRGGSAPRRNDPGMYTDFQLLFYLADPELKFLTQEDFSHEIRRSPQRDRILGLNALEEG